MTRGPLGLGDEGKKQKASQLPGVCPGDQGGAGGGEMLEAPSGLRVDKPRAPQLREGTPASLTQATVPMTGSSSSRPSRLPDACFLRAFTLRGETSTL